MSSNVLVIGAAVDSDGDRIPDAAENKSEVNGATIDNSDPNQMNLYVSILYSNDSERLSDTEKQQLRTIWASMNVSNPNGETGINLHIVEEQRAQHRFSKTYSGDLNETSNLDGLYNEYIDEGCGVYHLVAMGEIKNAESANVAGWGDVGGYATYVSDERVTYSTSEYNSRVWIITHELLHNVVGEINGEHAPGDPYHTQQGWLSTTQHERDLPENEALHPDVASQLSTEGFADSEQYSESVC
ncbi:hypothetical protein ACFQO4_19170 [Saliphagus sp. GCM10025334]